MNGRGIARWLPALVVMMLCSHAALAQPRGEYGPGGMGPAGPGGLPGMEAPGGPSRRGGPLGALGIRPEELAALGLTDAQRTQIAALRDSAIRVAIRADAEARIAELDLERLVESDHVDAASLTAQIARVTTPRARQLEARVKLNVGIRAVLTSQQRAKLKNLRSADAPEGRP